MVTIVEGNIWAVKADLRINTVNCVGVMGKGIALEFKKRYPAQCPGVQAENVTRGTLWPGSLHILERWSDRRSHRQLPTKTEWRKPSRYTYITIGLIKLREFL